MGRGGGRTCPCPRYWAYRFTPSSAGENNPRHWQGPGGGGAAGPAHAPRGELAHAGDGGRVGAATADVHNVFAAQRLNNAGPIYGVFVVMAQFPVVACDTSKKII